MCKKEKNGERSECVLKDLQVCVRDTITVPTIDQGPLDIKNVFGIILDTQKKLSNRTLE